MAGDEFVRTSAQSGMAKRKVGMTDTVRKIYWILSTQLGFDPRRLILSLRGVPRYLMGWLSFRKTYDGEIRFRPCLYDWYEEGGATKSEYFLQDLHVARQIHRANPVRHVDIGSRIDGFVAHVAAFRDVEVFDIRVVTSSIPGIKFTQADLTTSPDVLQNCCDSLSCLHALEHFGLGRYGDTIDPTGYVTGLINMIKLLKPGGVFYLSVPIGRERVEFNAHRVFNPQSLVRLGGANGLVLNDFTWIAEDFQVCQSLDVDIDMEMMSKMNYALGIFTFTKQIIEL